MLNYSLSCSWSLNLSSFWLILKQQWTIKISSPLFSIFSLVAILVGITGHKFGRGPSKDHSTKVWFKLAQWLQRSWLKCEKLTDRRQTLSGSGELKINITKTLLIKPLKNKHRMKMKTMGFVKKPMQCYNNSISLQHILNWTQ